MNETWDIPWGWIIVGAILLMVWWGGRNAPPNLEPSCSVGGYEQVEPYGYDYENC